MSGARHFFIVGSPRSGTTLLSVLIDRHSRMCVPPETAFFDEVAPRLAGGSGGGAAVADALRDWRRLPELGIGPEAVVRRLGGGAAGPGEVLAAILDLYAEARGKPRCGEKTPQHLPHVPTILRLFPDAPVFCLMRDGREAALSMADMPWWPPRTLADAADVWRRSADLASDLARAHPGRFRLVRYEDLAGRPAEVLGGVMETLGERMEPGQLDPAVPSGVVLPRSLAWKSGALGPVRSAAERERRSGATAEQTALLERLLGDHLRRHGYGP
jgi:hypothetical protein